MTIKLLGWKGYHGLLFLIMPYKQNGTPKVLPPLVVPISAHGLLPVVGRIMAQFK